MRPRPAPVTWLQAVGVYSALLGLWVAGSRMEALQIAWAPAEIIGWSISVLAVMGMLVFAGWRGWHRFGEPASTPSEEFGFRIREDTWREDEIESMVAMGERGIGANFPPPSWVRERLARNASIVRVARSTTTDEMVGFTMLYPLSANAARGIDRGRIRSGTELRASDMCKSFQRAHFVYIGVVAAEGHRARGFVLKMLRQQLRALDLGARSAAVYGKPATADGARLLRKFGFVPIPGNESIFRTDYDALTAKL